jgi:RNA polymerase sigma-70 factor (ECF subfamily)
MTAAASSSAESNFERNEQLGLLRQAVRQLRPEEQEVFLLRQNGELTYEEIGQAIGVPTGTVKTRMRLALTKLRKAVEAA